MRGKNFIGLVRVNNLNPEYLICTEYQKKPDGILFTAFNFSDKLKTLSEALYYSTPEEITGRDTKKILVGYNEILSPIEKPKNIIGVAWNYPSHNLETGFRKAPCFFPIHPDAISPPFSEISINEQNLIDYEVELGFVISKSLKKETIITDIREYIAGYLLANDITSRKVQINNGRLLWKTRGFYDAKSFPGFKPVGPILVPKIDEDIVIGLAIERNNQIHRRQHARVKEMYYSPSELIELLHDYMKNPERDKKTRDMMRGSPLERYLINTEGLVPGDLILTGTPDGTAFSSTTFDIIKSFGKRRFLEKEKNNPNYLRSGDKILAYGTNLGFQKITVI